MSITRRHFLLGTSAGLILPSWYEQSKSFFSHHGKPLLPEPRRVVDVLYAEPLRYDGSFSLTLGDACWQPPSMTVDEYAERFYGGRPQYVSDYCGEDPDVFDFDTIDWNEEADPLSVSECWPVDDIPCVKAYNLLKHLDLGPQLAGAQAVGELQFSGGSPGGNVSGVSAADAVTLSLLQQRLNELDQKIRIEIS